MAKCWSMERGRKWCRQPGPEKGISSTTLSSFPQSGLDAGEHTVGDNSPRVGGATKQRDVDPWPTSESKVPSSPQLPATSWWCMWGKSACTLTNTYPHPHLTKTHFMQMSYMKEYVTIPSQYQDESPWSDPNISCKWPQDSSLLWWLLPYC